MRSPTIRPRRLVAALAACGALASPLRLLAVEKGSEQVVPFYGSFSTSVAIEVPPHHGLEPRLALLYSSEGRNGFAGVGWQLVGLRQIERVNAGRGTPRWDASDVYLLDGVELLPCQAGMTSPSCSAGGTHAPKVESYERISRDAATDTWTVWATDGRKTVFSPVFTTTSGTLRWGMTSVGDPLGNSVVYTWSCVAGDCYPWTIQYNGYQVTFFQETRPDPFSFGTGVGLGTTARRLRSVFVYIPGVSHIRAYKLAYATSPASGRSLLVSVAQYGRDVTHDGTGLISGGTALPASTFGYQNDTLAKSFNPVAPAPASAPVLEAVTWTKRTGTLSTGDGSSLQKVDGHDGDWDAGASSTRAIAAGDGYLEITSGDRYTWGRMAGLSNGDSSVNPADIDFALYEYYDDTLYAYENGAFYGPFTRAQGDKLRVEVTAGVVRYTRNGATFYTSTRTPTYPLLADASIRSLGSKIESAVLSGSLTQVGFWCADKLMVGDFNGDGRSDQLCHDPRALTTRVALGSTGGSFAAPTLWLAGDLAQVLLGDFNADGKTDLGSFLGGPATFSVALSTGSAFSAFATWGTGQANDPNGALVTCKQNSSVPGTGDFNGDGLLDVSCRRADSIAPSATGFTLVGLSTGSAFSFGYWGNLGCDAPYYQSTAAIDFDGDGKDDWMCLGSTTGVLNVYPSTGATFEQLAFGSLGPSFCGQSSVGQRFGDFNGDGRTDVVCGGNGTMALSTGRSFLIQGTYGATCLSSTEPNALLAADVDGDGAAELVCNDSGAGPADVQVRRWSAGALAAAETWRASWCAGEVRAGDFDGDAKGDLLCTTLAAPVALAGTSGVRSDLVTSARTPLGGTTEVTYRPSTDYGGTNNPPSRPVITSLTRKDGRGQAASEQYSYSGGLMDRRERKYRGFRYAKRVLPCIAGETSCPYFETWFRQDDPTGSPIERINRKDGAGNLHRVTMNSYTIATAAPYTSHLTTEYHLTLRGLTPNVPCTGWPCADAKRRRITHAFDLYGNETQRVDYGDNEQPGDEVTTVWQWRPNLGSFLVNRPARKTVVAGSVATGQVLSDRTWSYDGSATWDSSPVRGLPTASSKWLDSAGIWAATTRAFDGFGNLVSLSDESGRTTVAEFDARGEFMTAQVNGEGERLEAVWDRVCGAITLARDPNLQVTTQQHDMLCRPVLRSRPLGNYERFQYLAIGDPNAQRVVVEAPSPDPEGTAVPYQVEEYFDGFRRTYRELRSGPGASWIARDWTYDPRGSLSSRTDPYDASGPASTTLRFFYDGLDRPIQTLFPDQSSIATNYGLLSTTTVDQEGGSTTLRHDVRGRVTSSEQALGSQLLTAARNHDLQGRLIGLADAAGNQWAWSFDSLGRVTSVTDPDSGPRQLDYDLAGRLLAVTDAKGQHATFEYDAAGRLTARTTADGRTEFAYSEERPGYRNVGQLTTMRDQQGLLQMDYDSLGRAVVLHRSINGTEYRLEYQFDSGGRIRGIVYPDGDQIGGASTPIRYDHAGRLVALPDVVDYLEYDAADRPVRLLASNGTETTWSYSAVRGWLMEKATAVGTNWLQSLAYGRDRTGRVTSILGLEEGSSKDYTYDQLGRLISASDPGAATEQTLAYDLAGNIVFNATVGALAYPAAGQVRPHAPTAVAGAPMSYDANGNLLSGRNRVIEWTADNQPLSINGVVYVYDGLGRRLGRTAPGETTAYPFGDDYEVQATSGGTITTKYFSVPGIGIVAKRVDGQGYWLHTDHQGSITAVTADNGAVVLRRSYGPFGDQTSESGKHSETRGWIDQRQDPMTGIIYLHARSYDPALGLFLSPDPSHPLDRGVGLNRYQYGLGDPVNRADRSGLQPPIAGCVFSPKDGGGGGYWMCPDGTVWTDEQGWINTPNNSAGVEDDDPGSRPEEEAEAPEDPRPNEESNLPEEPDERGDPRDRATPGQNSGGSGSSQQGETPPGETPPTQGAGSAQSSTAGAIPRTDFTVAHKVVGLGWSIWATAKTVYQTYRPLPPPFLGEVASPMTFSPMSAWFLTFGVPMAEVLYNQAAHGTTSKEINSVLCRSAANFDCSKP